MSDYDREARAEQIMHEMGKGRIVPKEDLRFLEVFLKSRRKVWTGVDLPNGLKRAQIKVSVKEKLEKRR